MSTPSPPEPFQLALRVEAADIEEMDHVNNTVYLRWVQDAATAHWRSIASDEEFQSIQWVVLRHEIDYRRQRGSGTRCWSRPGWAKRAA